MNAMGFAWRSLVRQPARASLGVIGVAAVGALLFDMLLLSHGLVISMRDLFERAGFDVRVAASDALPGQGPALTDAAAHAVAIARLPSVRAAIALRLANAVVQRETPAAAQKEVRPAAQAAQTGAPKDSPRGIYTAFEGAGGTGSHPWTIVRGHDIGAGADLVVNENTSRRVGIAPGDRVVLRAQCTSGDEALPPMVFTVTGVAQFPFDAPNGATVATSLDRLADACGGNERGEADVILVAAAEGFSSDAAAADVAKAVPELRVYSNAQLVSRFERGGFTYFRQISTVLTTVTLSFAVLLITVLLTVSVNQRLGEIAALRALGFSRWRVVADVLCESVLIVGGGGLLSLPLGAMLAFGLDRILKRIPGIPAEVHFFVFEPAALQVHALLLVATAIIAALYPIRIVATLPIAATLRDEVIG
jgi:putative ABC transport system permease protein